MTSSSTPPDPSTTSRGSTARACLVGISTSKATSRFVDHSANSATGSTATPRQLVGGVVQRPAWTGPRWVHGYLGTGDLLVIGGRVVGGHRPRWPRRG